MKRSLTSGLIIILAITFVPAQNLLNKLKSKAQQEVNKLESGAIKNSQTNKNKLSANVTRTVAVSLGSNEVFDYQENCIDLGTSLNQVSFIVNKRVGNSVQCFSYKNGVRTPVACPNASTNCGGSLQCSQYKLREMNLSSDEAKKYVVTQSEAHKVETPTISDQQLKMMQAYMTAEQIEQVKKSMAEAAKQTQGQTYSTPISSTINFNGKSFGPFKQINQFFLTPEENNFYAVVTEDSKAGSVFSYRLITSASSATLAAPGFSPPALCFVAPDQSEFGMYVLGNDQKYSIITSSGKTYSVASGEQLSAAWYVGHQIISLTTNYPTGSKLYRDGQLLKTFEGTATHDPCNLFVGMDGKVTEIKDNTISFADGDYYQFPLKMSLVNEGGKNYFKWLALENQEVVIYRKPN